MIIVAIEIVVRGKVNNLEYEVSMVLTNLSSEVNFMSAIWEEKFHRWPIL
jgi:hypothetical protein